MEWRDESPIAAGDQVNDGLSKKEDTTLVWMAGNQKIVFIAGSALSQEIDWVWTEEKMGRSDV